MPMMCLRMRTAWLLSISHTDNLRGGRLRLSINVRAVRAFLRHLRQVEVQ